MNKGNNYNHKLPNIDDLVEIYFKDKLSTNQIAIKFNVTTGAVKNKLNRYGIKLRTNSEAQKGNKNKLGYKYSEEHNKSQSILFKKLGIRPPSRKGIKLTEEHKKRIGLAQTGEKSSNWQGGISFEPYPISFNKALKKIIKQRDNHTCQLCLKQGNAVHHIDYIKKNCNSDNLITLCFGCNAAVNFNRDYWTRYFGNIIRKRLYATQQKQR